MCGWVSQWSCQSLPHKLLKLAGTVLQLHVRQPFRCVAKSNEQTQQSAVEPETIFIKDDGLSFPADPNSTNPTKLHLTLQLHGLLCTKPVHSSLYFGRNTDSINSFSNKQSLLRQQCGTAVAVVRPGMGWGAKPPKCHLAPATVKHTGQQSGGELGKNFDRFCSQNL